MIPTKKLYIYLCFAASLFSCFSVEAFLHNRSFDPSAILFEINTPSELITVYTPTSEEIYQTASLAKSIFIEAFSTTYTEYHRQSGSRESIEKWLRLREGLSVTSWLSGVFDEDYQDYWLGKKAFIYLCNADGSLIGWLSHSPMSEQGEIYLSQCSLEANYRHRHIATKAFSIVFQENFIKNLFPEAKKIKLITRKINTIAKALYTKVGFTLDETIDPSIYGDSYDERYVGFQLTLK